MQIIWFTKEVIVDRGEKAEGQGDRGELGMEVETANEVGS